MDIPNVLSMSQNSQSIDISIVCFNNIQTIKNCVRSCLEQEALGTLILVDNFSTDGTRELIYELSKEDSRVQVHFLDKNYGFGYGHNLAIQKLATANFHAIVNPDIEFKEQKSLINLREFLIDSPNTGAVVPKFLNMDGSIQRQNKRFPSVWDLFLRRSPHFFQNYFKDRLDRYVMKDFGYEDSYSLYAVCGALIFLKRSIFLEVGGFDERYFLYFEDVDLGREIQKKYCCKYNPNVQVYHHWNRSAHKSLKPFLYFLRSGFKYFNKWGWSIF